MQELFSRIDQAATGAVSFPAVKKTAGAESFIAQIYAVMADFAGSKIGPTEEFTVNNKSATNTGAERDYADTVEMAQIARAGLTKSGGVGVVFDVDGHHHTAFYSRLDWRAGPAWKIARGSDDFTGHTIDDTSGGNTDAGQSVLFLKAVYQT